MPVIELVLNVGFHFAKGFAFVELVGDIFRDLRQASDVIDAFKSYGTFGTLCYRNRRQIVANARIRCPASCEKHEAAVEQGSHKCRLRCLIDCW